MMASNNASAQQSTPSNIPPGAISVGPVNDDAGHPTHRLILLPQRPDKRLNWQDAMAWAASVGGDLPNPQEQSLLFANCRDALPKAWCWSNKEHEKDASFAWGCYFLNGIQHGTHKSCGGSAVAVRRLALESFNSSDGISAHVCTPSHERRYKPRNYGAVVAVDGRDHLTARRAAPKTRAPKLPFPPLPEADKVGYGAFWHAAFLRDLRMLQIGNDLLQKAYSSGGPIDGTSLYHHNSLLQQKREVKDSFLAWVDAIGGLASSACHQEGGAA